MEDVLEAPPEETPGWHSSEQETSQMLAHDRAADGDAGGRLLAALEEGFASLG